MTSKLVKKAQSARLKGGDNKPSDKNKLIRCVFPPDTPAQEIAEALQKLLKEGSPQHSEASKP
jgi:hypothetical protein